MSDDVLTIKTMFMLVWCLRIYWPHGVGFLLSAKRVLMAEQRRYNPSCRTESFAFS